MYYKSKRNTLKMWLFNKHTIIYSPILLILGILIFFLFKNMNIPSINEVNNEGSTAVVSENETTSSTSFITQNTTYLIKINKSMNFITVFKPDSNNQFNIVYKTFRCSVNPNIAIGSYNINEKYVWRMLGTNQYGYYTSRISSAYYIHSVPYSSEQTSSLIKEAYNNLGNPATIGSIYLAVEDSKWIYENCRIDTVIEVYEAPNEVPAMALGEKVTLPFNTGYHPSDVEVQNKIVENKIDYLQGVKDKSIPVGSKIDLWEGINAVDLEGNNITSFVLINGSVNTAVAGKYTVTYILIDKFGTNLAYNSIITVY